MKQTRCVNSKRKLTGFVVSNKCLNTITVRVDRRYRHPKYKKFLIKSKKYYAHVNNVELEVGQKVTIIESRPFSKLKRWELYLNHNIVGV